MALVNSLDKLWNWNKSEDQELPNPDLKHESTQDETVEEEGDMGEDSPVLEFNEWLAYTNWANLYKEDLENWKNQYNIGNNGHGYSEKAYQDWAGKADERNSTLPAYKQKRRWIYKRVRKLNRDPNPRALLSKVQDISKASALQQRKKRTKRGIKPGKPEKVERRMGPNLPGKAVSLISAAAMDAII